MFLLPVFCKRDKKLELHVQSWNFHGKYIPEIDTCPFPELCSGNDKLFMSIPNKLLQKTTTTNNKEINDSSE